PPRDRSEQPLGAVQEFENPLAVLADQLGRRGGEKLPVALRREPETRRNLGDALPDLLGGRERRGLVFASRRQVAHVRRPFGVGVTQTDRADRLPVRKDALDLETLEEPGLV